MLLEELVLMQDHKSVATLEQEPFYLLYQIHNPLTL